MAISSAGPLGPPLSSPAHTAPSTLSAFEAVEVSPCIPTIFPQGSQTLASGVLLGCWHTFPSVFGGGAEQAEVGLPMLTQVGLAGSTPHSACWHMEEAEWDAQVLQADTASLRTTCPRVLFGPPGN